MGDPNISIGNPTFQDIPAGDAWTVLATGLIVPADGRTKVSGQFATSLPTTLTSRPTMCEIQLVRETPTGDNPTMQDDRAFTLTIDLTTGKVLRVNKRQNWLWSGEMRTYSDEPLRVEARHPGPVKIVLEWIVKLVLIRPEVGA